MPNGLYEMWVGYRVAVRPEGIQYRVDNEYGSGTFDQSSTFSADRAGLFNLTGGTNTLGIYEGLGLLRRRLPRVPSVHAARRSSRSPHSSADPLGQSKHADADELPDRHLRPENAGRPSARRQQNLPFPSSTYLNLSGGLKPAIRGSDFIEYSPTRIAVRRQSKQRVRAIDCLGQAEQRHPQHELALERAGQPGDTIQANGPWWRGFYTKARRSICPARWRTRPAAITSCCFATSTRSASS